YYAPAADIEGSPRPNPAGSNPDMGAYENSLSHPLYTPITINVPGDYATIQAALNAADSTDTVLVQPDTYTENIIWPETNGIKLIGAGDSSNTIIDGGGVSSVLYMNPTGVTIDSTTVIQGFKITNGGNVSNGSGIMLVGASPKIKSMFITNNIATDNGGGFYLDSSDPMITDVSISENSVNSSGGGLYLQNESNPTFNGITIFGNSASVGGGMYLYYSCNPIITGVIISNNTANDAGGLFLANNCSPIVTDVIISNNTASVGGGLFLSHDCSPIMTGVIISNNTANNGGGGYFRFSSSPVLNEVIINGNSASNRGGGFYYLGIYDLTTNGVIISGNNAFEGGGMFLDGSTPTMVDVIVTGNRASHTGGGMYIHNTSNPTLSSVILTNNFAGNQVGGIYISSGNLTISNSNFLLNGHAIYNADNSNITQALNNYWGHTSGPYHPSQNPTGQGDSTNVFVNVNPWLTTPNTDAPPIPAQNLSTTATGNDFISLAWDLSAIGDLAGYKVYYDTDTTGYPYTNSVDVNNATTYTLSGLTPATIYYIAITTYDIDDNESWYSDEVTGVTRVLQASNLDIADDEDLNHIVTHIPAITFGYYDSMGELQTHYHAQVSSHVDFSIIDFWDSGETASADTSITYAGTELVDGDTYYLRIKVSAGGFWSDWTELSFRMNSNPTAPVSVYPINDEVSGTPVVLKVLNSSDAESDTISYSFNIYSDAGLTTKLDSATAIVEGIDTTSWQVTAILPDNSQYWWTASANDGYEESAISGAASFLLNIANDAPAAFTLLSPADSSEVDTLNPLLVWESAFDPDPLDTVRYTLYFDTPSPGVHTISTDTSTTYQTPPLLDNTTYYWKVVATDLFGATTENSGGFQSFRINTTNDLPGDFALFNPDNGSMVTVLTPTFLWEVPIDPDDQRSRSITSYDLYLGLDSSFTAVEPISVDTNQFTPLDNLTEDQLYYWKVIAFDNDGGNTISNIWSFWTNSQNSIPSYFHVISPI
ncbi:MAG: fibronectin type III domain-containing protein, partial [Candidatus Marinimicrobia bacterium]|nr:fibronectin type III domain-containing protein [Candidatus Neomarinimicrobiota bacterium]